MPLPCHVAGVLVLRRRCHAFGSAGQWRSMVMVYVWPLHIAIGRATSIAKERAEEDRKRHKEEEERRLAREEEERRLIRVEEDAKR